MRSRMSRRGAGLLAGALVVMFAHAGGAAANGPSLTVTNLGQPTAPVEVGQAPIGIAAAGSCASPFTLANQAACPAGTWPPLGQPWGQILNVAGGDGLRLEFSGPVTAVKVGSTSNYEPGLTDPDGNPVANYDVVPETSAVATPDPKVWAVGLPPLDARAISSQGYTFSVVAEDGSGSHDYPFGIRAPRYADEAAKCGRAFFSTGWEQYICASKEIPPGLPGEVRRKKRKCKKGFRRKKVRGKARCVKVKKAHPKRHHR
jgi:hypothetical protein